MVGARARACARVCAFALQVKTQRMNFMCSYSDIILSDNCRLSLLVDPRHLQYLCVQVTTCSLGGSDVCETNEKKK